MTAEEIVKKLAAIDAPVAVGYMDREYCALHRACRVTGLEPASHHHEDCPWRMAQEWVAQNPDNRSPS